MELIKAIEQTRQAMIDCIYSRGLTDEKTLKLSRELDKLIVESQLIKSYKMRQFTNKCEEIANKSGN
ncbi:aspartyl-phosphate phosphatase Spo0E family protein [Cytobacillus oceanisediminis]|uniref:aspartyl-phosphate phosphatase Spo0E family protein n=1 Tax=Cytobacillus oceanisediminis TaxID=665099 RepID=UPI001C237149|nr:aspartyl-phosphate phosphatase Spo0E family protein [Cytobacillus oceanisediminis]MBU8769153.1 aspartyl-phosphate phosphatase Spo0E family protein [Cytobacillus oceanisediminis]MCM3392391.1 aspartyl-phosphate phosphatase Spo0E family protein [Cytobacillus oceanisediminis]